MKVAVCKLHKEICQAIFFVGLLLPTHVNVFIIYRKKADKMDKFYHSVRLMPRFVRGVLIALSGALPRLSAFAMGRR